MDIATVLPLIRLPPPSPREERGQGGGDPQAPWLACRGREWARVRGASPLMRMAASWSDGRACLDHVSNTRSWRAWRHVMAGSPLIALRGTSVDGSAPPGRVSGTAPPTDAPTRKPEQWKGKEDR